jgi:uncharacterized membrane protein YeiB
MTAHLSGPVQAWERIQTLDIVRGFALIGILIIYFVVQVALSTIWLRRFEYGALEDVWRVGTYGRRVAPIPVASVG